MNKEKKMYIDKIMGKIAQKYNTESGARHIVEKELHKLTINALSNLYAMTLTLDIVKETKFGGDTGVDADFTKGRDDIYDGVYCHECGERMTEAEYSCGQCKHCGGDVVGEEEMGHVSEYFDRKCPWERY